MLFIFAVVFVLNRYFTEAAPLPAQGDRLFGTGASIFPRDDSTTVDGCHARTVWNILWSCLATTFACSWVSVHPNVPFKNEGRWEILARRVFLMFFSILAPEIMVMWLFKQWRGAVMIRESVNHAKPGPRAQKIHYLILQYANCRSPSTTVGYRPWALYADGRVQSIDDTKRIQ